MDWLRFLLIGTGVLNLSRTTSKLELSHTVLSPGSNLFYDLILSSRSFPRKDRGSRMASLRVLAMLLSGSAYASPRGLHNLDKSAVLYLKQGKDSLGAVLLQNS